MIVYRKKTKQLIVKERGSFVQFVYIYQRGDVKERVELRKIHSTILDVKKGTFH